MEKRASRLRAPFVVAGSGWIITNSLGIAAFLYFASRTWIEPALRGETVGREGDAVVYFISAVPVAAASFLADLVMIAFAIVTYRRTRNWSLLAISFIIGVAWLLAAVVDIHNRF